ncbi:MAG TPA: NAD(P)/FAD-dependent oxidoreductase [Polyangiaceae bacterium]|nr:NAD(P)/FAD-dependent oxidoreductase [Polyangiaceae bacterium]
MTDFDLVIAGGGPVGLVTAIAARQRGLSAVVIERNAELPEKACGEGLMPGAVTVLDALGVSLRDGVAFRGIRFVDGARVAAAEFPQQSGRAVARRQLMLALAARARAVGVEVWAGHTLRDFHYRERVLSAEVSGAGRVRTLRGQLLVAADGLRSGIRRRLDYELPPRRPQRFGLQRHYRCSPWTDWVEVHWHDRAEAYVTPLGAGEVGVALLCHGAPAPYDELLRSFPALERSLAGVEPPGRVRGAGPFEQRTRAVLAPGVALVGDAAGYLDAVSGEGLALGFRAAVALVDRFASGELWRYPNDHARLCSTHHAITWLMLEIARRPQLRRSIIQFLGAHPALFSDLLGIAADARVPARSWLGSTLRWALSRLVLAS